MANLEHLEILKQGVEVWNQWREENHGIRPDLSRADLVRVDLSGANLGGSILHRTNLSGAKLVNADFGLTYTPGGALWGTIATKVLGTILQDANLALARFTDGTMADADLKGSYLMRTVFERVDLNNVDFTNAHMSGSYFAEVDLSHCVGLEEVNHNGPSYISAETFYMSGGDIPKEFLRGAGIPDEFITFVTSQRMNSVDYDSVFISYSSKNEDFAKRLHADLQDHGVRCWFAPEDLKIGERIRARIDHAIQVHDKLMLILSEASVASDWVEYEVETAMDHERDQGGTTLFPIRVDDAVMEEKAGWAAHLKRTRNIGDFTDWKDHDKYQKAFDRLLGDLRA